MLDRILRRVAHRHAQSLTGSEHFAEFDYKRGYRRVITRYAAAMTVRPDTRYPGPTLADRAQWLLRAKPADYLLAMSVASASLPVVGKHLEPLGGYTAMGVWGYRHTPEILVSVMKSWLRPGACGIRRGQRDQTNFVS